MRINCGLRALMLGLILLGSVSTVEARCLAQNQWAYANCSTSTYTTRTYNYNGYGAAAAYGLQILGAAAAAQQQYENQQAAAENAARNRQIAARNAYCLANWRNAANLTERANQLWDQNWDPAAAIPLYEQAIAYLRPCGDGHNINIVSGNLTKARKEYAAYAPDNRVSDAIKNYSDQNIYTKPNPFTVKNTTGASAPHGFNCSKPPIDANVAWYYSCHPKQAGSANLERVAYRHPISPQTLYSRAADVCVGKRIEEQRQCIVEAKVRILLNEDPKIRSECGSYEVASNLQIACVDRFYLYGPNADSAAQYIAYTKEVYDHRSRIDAAIRKRLNELVAQRDTYQETDPRWVVLDREVTRYNDALLGVESTVPEDAERLSHSIVPDALTPIQTRLDRVARASVDAAIEANKASLREADRKECAVIAYKTVQGALTGFGGANVPEKCRTIVYDAIAQLAFQAAAQIDTRTAPEEDLLQRYLTTRYANTGGTNDGQLGPPLDARGLTPDEDMQNHGEFLRKK